MRTLWQTFSQMNKIIHVSKWKPSHIYLTACDFSCFVQRDFCKPLRERCPQEWRAKWVGWAPACCMWNGLNSTLCHHAVHLVEICQTVLILLIILGRVTRGVCWSGWARHCISFWWQCRTVKEGNLTKCFKFILCIYVYVYMHAQG